MTNSMESIKLWILLIVLSLISPSCASIQFLQASSQRGSFDALESHSERAYRDYAGLIHVHSRFSNDSNGNFDQIATSARKAGCDFVVVTDHNSLRGIDEKMDGFYGSVLILVGAEYTTEAGHLVVLGGEKELDRTQSLTELLRDVQKSGAVSFIAHGESHNKSWHDWEVASVTGMEVYNLTDDLNDEWKLWKGLKYLFLPPSYFFRSIMDEPVNYLKRWDQKTKAQPFVGIGSLDAHRKLKFLGLPLDDYYSSFRTVQTHVFADSLSKQGIIEALRAGRAYLSFDVRKKVQGFYYVAQTGNQLTFMGETVEISHDLRFEVQLPEKAEIRLLREGQMVLSVESDHLDTPVEREGVYRIEVYRKKKLWILSNPIYVTEKKRVQTAPSELPLVPVSLVQQEMSISVSEESKAPAVADVAVDSIVEVVSIKDKDAPVLAEPLVNDADDEKSSSII